MIPHLAKVWLGVYTNMTWLSFSIHDRSWSVAAKGTMNKQLHLPINYYNSSLLSSSILLEQLQVSTPWSSAWLCDIISPTLWTICHGITHVEYVLKAARLAVKFGRCSGNSHGLTPVWSRGSWVGGLSTIYEIQACHPGSICDLPIVRTSFYLSHLFLQGPYGSNSFSL